LDPAFREDEATGIDFSVCIPALHPMGGIGANVFNELKLAKEDWLIIYMNYAA
jgi:hypothetical protein